MMIFITLEGYKNKSDISLSDGSFNYYLTSKCESAVFVTDSYMFSVYSKNETVLKKAIDFAQKNYISRIEIIENNNADFFFGV